MENDNAVEITTTSLIPDDAPEYIVPDEVLNRIEEVKEKYGLDVTKSK